MGASRFASMKVGDCTSREFGKPNIHEIVVTKEMDMATIGLYGQLCKGKSCGTATIHFVHTNGVYAKLLLENTIISDYILDGYDNNERPAERVTLNFTKFELTYIPYTADNNAGSPLPMGYDLAAAQVS